MYSRQISSFWPGRSAVHVASFFEDHTLSDAFVSALTKVGEGGKAMLKV